MVALVALVETLRARGFPFIDCQMRTPLLASACSDGMSKAAGSPSIRARVTPRRTSTLGVMGAPPGESSRPSSRGESAALRPCSSAASAALRIFTSPACAAPASGRPARRAKYAHSAA